METESKKREIVEVETSAKNLQKDEKEYKYTAFISYRHLEPDITVAKAVHKAIETFKLPKEFYEGGKRPTFRVFRDREELTTTSLSDSIQDALENSKYLIVICSKRLRESKWCNIEVETFIGLHGVEKVIPVLIEGEPEDSFPKALIHDWEDKEIEEDGTVEVQDYDILAAELRPEEVIDPSFIGYEALGEKNPGKVKELGNAAVKLLKTEKFRIMAAILGVSYGDLKNRDKARRQRTLLGISAVVSAALLFFGIFMVNAYRNENAAKRVTLQDKSSFMLDEAELLLDDGNRMASLNLASEALGELDDKMERYEELKDRHHYLLQSGLNARRSSYNAVIPTGNQFSFVDIKNDTEEMVVGLGNDSIGVFDLKSGIEKKRITGHSQQVKLLSFSEDEKKLVSGGFDGKIILWDASSYEKVLEITTPGNIMLLQWGAGDRIDVIYDTIDAYYFQAYDGDNLEELGEPLLLENGIKRIAFSGDGSKLWLLKDTFQEKDSLYQYDLASGNLKVFDDVIRESEEEDYSVPYKDLRVSKDKASIYTISAGALQKREALTGNLLWENKDFSWIQDELLALEGDALYVGDGSNLVKLDKDTGESIYTIRTGGTTLTDGVMSEDGSIITLLDQEGYVWMIGDDEIQDLLRPSAESHPSYIFLNDEGSFGATLSLLDQEVKLFDVLPEASMSFMDGQVAGTSIKGTFMLLYKEGAYELLDVLKGESIKTLTHEYLPTYSEVLGDYFHYQVSDDGKLLSGLYRYLDDDGNVIRATIFVLDTSTEEVLQEVPAPRGSFSYGFSDNGQWLLYSEGYNLVHSLEVHSGKAQALQVEKGFISGFKMNSDASRILVSYSEGDSLLYDRESGELLQSYVGDGLKVSDTDEGTKVHLLYNNLLSTYVGDEKKEEVLLSDKRREAGDDFNDRNFFDSEEKYLLTIKSRNSEHLVLLLDAHNGELLSRYELTNYSYRPKGFFTPEGNSFYLDFIFGSRTEADDTYRAYQRIGIFPISNYETLLEMQRNRLGIGDESDNK